MRHGMICKRGDIVLINFPFTTLSRSKKRPVLVVKNENKYNDFVCFQVTSKPNQSNVHAIESSNIVDGDLTLRSFVKYDKCFTLNSELVDKKLASVDNDFMETLKKLFCNEI
jgi:mRNA interferase MazF